MNEAKIPATLAILTRNSGATLARTLESARVFSDIVICDGGSTDNTRAIAEGFGARVIMQDKEFLDRAGRIFDFAGVRNQTLDAAKHNWFFFLDSDEYCGQDLIEAIRTVVSERTEGAFWVSRKYVLRGTVIDCASTYPNRQMRFFSRASVERFVKKVHERIRVKEGTASEELGGTMYIPFDGDVSTIRLKWEYQIAVEVAQRGSITLVEFLSAILDASKISLLWLVRLFVNMLFCKGVHMPLRYEYERQRFHVRLLAALWEITKVV